MTRRWAKCKDELVRDTSKQVSAWRRSKDKIDWCNEFPTLVAKHNVNVNAQLPAAGSGAAEGNDAATCLCCRWHIVATQRYAR
jgi:hypothetical protein